MDEDFRQEDKNDSAEFNNYNTSSLPPRSTLHNIKENDESGGNKIIQLLFSSFVFIVIIVVILVIVFTHEKKDIEPVNNDPNVTQEAGQNNNVSEDNSQTDLSESDSNETTGQSGDSIDSNTNSEEDTGEENLPTDNDSEQDTVQTDVNESYVIQSGDNLYRISLKFYETGKYFEALALYNNLADVDDIYAGLKIEIPPIEKLQ